jgi:DNA invertase Pin-like site-specific DNA recombinase
MRALIYTSNASVNRKHREYQQALCLRHAEEKGYTVLDIVYDVGRDRTEMERVLDRARAGEFDVLVTINLARLGRHYPAVRALVDEFEAAGITLYLCDQPVAWGLTLVRGHADSSICWGSEIMNHGQEELLRRVSPAGG